MVKLTTEQKIEMWIMVVFGMMTTVILAEAHQTALCLFFGITTIAAALFMMEAE